MICTYFGKGYSIKSFNNLSIFTLQLELRECIYLLIVFLSYQLGLQHKSIIEKRIYNFSI